MITIATPGGAAFAAASGSTIDLLDGTLYDLSLAPPFGRPGTSAEPVAIVALDPKSLSSEYLRAVPRVFFGLYHAELIGGLFAAGARAVGFDIISNYVAARFPAIDTNYDAPFLNAHATHRRKLVLARSGDITLADLFVAAVWDSDRETSADEPDAVANDELAPSADGVTRRVQREYTAEDRFHLRHWRAAWWSAPADPRCRVASSLRRAFASKRLRSIHFRTY